MVLYVLNRIIYRKQEMERNEIPFLCHSSTDYAKILWKKGEAIGFYSVKPTGEFYKLLRLCCEHLHFDPQLCQCLLTRALECKSRCLPFGFLRSAMVFLLSCERGLLEKPVEE